MNKGLVRKALQEAKSKHAYIEYISHEGDDGMGYELSRVEGIVDEVGDNNSVTLTNGKQRIYFDYGSVGIIAVGHALG